jgi:hypothetical protein
MKTYLKIALLGIFSIIMTDVAAQTNDKFTNRWPVSKDVQRYSNKRLAAHNPIKIKSVGTPSFVQSKGVNKRKSEVAGNMQSTGTPDWVISKPVNLINR